MRAFAHDFAFGPAGCLMLGLGYIGDATFIVTQLREQSVCGAVVVAFYVLLGAGVIASLAARQRALPQPLSS